jgi:hypothetical protein
MWYVSRQSASQGVIMFVAYAVVAVILSLVLIASGRGKLVRDQRIVESLTAVGVRPSWYPYLAACEFAGVLGLLVGLVVAPLGIAAAIGVALYFVGAVIAHLRARDVKGLGLPLALFAVAVLALVFRLASA